jgi:hypothetical protein
VSWNSNLGGWFGGSSRSRELDELRRSWERTEALWRASPIAAADREDPVGKLSLELNQESWDRAGRVPPTPIAVAVGHVIADLLSEENIGKINPLWGAIEGDVSAALEFRQVLARRSRYAAEFSRIHEVVSRNILTACETFYAALPEGAYDRSEGDSSFEVALGELLEDPAELIRQFIALAFRREVIDLDLFENLRIQLRGNLLLASGLDPADWRHETITRLIYPADQRNKSPSELADLYLAGTPYRELFDAPIPFRISPHVRFSHGHIVGGTGHGKTQLLQKMIHADLLAARQDGRSVVVVDSQGDLINKLVRLDLLDPNHPSSLAHRLILIDPADIEFPPSLNLFDAKLARLSEYRPVDRERVQNGVIELYERFFGDLLGAELTQKQGVVFKYLARLMLVIPDATIYTLMRLMEDGRPFRPHMEKLQGSARYFFEHEFFDPSFGQTKKQILKRLWGVLSTPAFERLFAQPRNKLDLFQALQDGKIVLVSTAKDLLKEEGSALFGRFFVSLLSQAALERSTVPEAERTPTFVYVDEAQEYFDDSIETILNQARKYRVGITLAHQTLDQLSPKLRAALHANTSLKCAGGVSARDARTFAEELHTTADFIERMRRRGDRTEFAAWVKGQTPGAIRMSVPLGFLERQSVLSEEAYDELLTRNREEYCGTLDEVLAAQEAAFGQTAKAPEPPPPAEPQAGKPSEVPDVPKVPHVRPDIPRPEPPAPAPQGKGGPKHRYLQSLVKELGEQYGFRAVVEAPLPSGPGQVDVLLVREGLSAAVEISVTTPAEYERENVRKCLRSGFSRVALVHAKSARSQGRYQDVVGEGLSTEERERLTFLLPEELPDYIAALAAPPAPTERVVRGYKVKVTQTSVSPEEARARREALARLLAKSLNDG